MKKLPDAVLYEAGLQYWPDMSTFRRVLDFIKEQAPEGGTLLDIMCGPGYLLGQITKVRGDLMLKGVDIKEEYVQYGNETYRTVSFEQGDVLNWQSVEQYDVVVCTGAIHHVHYSQQEQAIANIASLVKPGGIVLISDVYITDYSSERERRLAAAELGYAYIVETIENGATDEVFAWTADILQNDVLMYEYKTSIEKRMTLLRKYLNVIKTEKIWPHSVVGWYGDYVHICRTW